MPHEDGKRRGHGLPYTILNLTHFLAKTRWRNRQKMGDRSIHTHTPTHPNAHTRASVRTHGHENTHRKPITYIPLDM